MTPEDMRSALAIEAEARKLKRQFDEFVLIKMDGHMPREILNVGDPVLYRQGEYHRIEVPIPETARRYVFNRWRKEIALKFNDHVRKLAQIGMTTDLRLIEFNPATGDAQP